MRTGLAVEQIYDAAFDDDALTALTQDLSHHLGARSALIHWMHRDGSANVMAHSGYFSDEQLQLYAREFAAIDPWMHATAAPEHGNRVHDFEALVPARIFARSDFYNDYVRVIGDDTARCLGVRMESRHGSGFIALQRGLRQSPFEANAARSLQRYSGHLMRMLAMRGRLLGEQRRSTELAGAIDALDHPALLLDAGLHLKHSNKAAERLLDNGKLLTVRDGVIAPTVRRMDAQLRTLIAQVLGSEVPSGLSFSCADGHAANVSIASIPVNGGPRLALLLVTQSATDGQARSTRLRDLYALTPAEACLAGMLADGLTPLDIAEKREVAVGTVRVQIKQIAFKLGCHRQAEIVKVVCSLPPLRMAE